MIVAPSRIWPFAAAIIAIAVPAWLLWSPHEQSPSGSGMTVAKPAPAGDVAPLDGRELFAAGEPGAAAILPEGAPDLAGIIGRPPHDAVALIRTEDGRTKTLAPGQIYQGWKLDAVSGDAASFSRNARRIRVAVPDTDPVEGSEAQ